MTPTLSTRPRHAALRAAPAAMALAMLAACGGGDDDGTAPPVVGAYTVGGALSGLAAGRTVTLQNNAENDLQLSANGSFEFSTRLDHGVRYAVTIKNQPAGQRCAVSQGTGTATANVRDVRLRQRTGSPCGLTAVPPSAPSTRRPRAGHVIRASRRLLVQSCALLCTSPRIPA